MFIGKRTVSGQMENNAKGILQKATIDLVAEEGLHGFSMKRVTQRAGVSEALVYKHFGTKENLLFSCFLSVHKQIGALFNNLNILALNHTKAEMYTAVRMYWMIYFDYLVRHGNETIFYFSFRDSTFTEKIRAHRPEDAVTTFKDFAGFVDAVDAKVNLYNTTTQEHLWTYVLDTTGMFARRVIRGDLPNTPESIEHIWRLIFGGIAGLLNT